MWRQISCQDAREKAFHPERYKNDIRAVSFALEHILRCSACKHWGRDQASNWKNVEPALRNLFGDKLHELPVTACGPASTTEIDLDGFMRTVRSILGLS